MASVEFVGQSMADQDNEVANTSRLINRYREPVGVEKFVLKSVLGTTAFASTGGVFVRAMERVGSLVYVACGGALYSVSSAGAVVTLGAITDSADTTISGNNGAVAVAAGGSYYVWDGSTLSSPTGGEFSAVGSVTFIGQRTVMSESGGRKVQWSGLVAPETLSTDFRTAEARDDDILRLMPIGGMLFVFKERSIERWYETGDDSVFGTAGGGAFDVGLKAYGLVAKFSQGAFFVGSDGRAYVTAGASPQPVSTVAVETSIAQSSPTHVFYYRDEAHDFCVIRFSDRPAWCLDISTGEWHERAEGEDSAWSATACVDAFGKFLIGTDLGNVLELTTTREDNGSPLIRRAISKTLMMEGRRFRVPRLQFTGRVGRGEIGRDPMLMLFVSKDSGNTWGAPKERSLGALGDYDQQVVFRSLGQFRQMTVEVRVSDPVEAPIAATAFVEVA